MPATAKRPYHHGNLRQTLLEIVLKMVAVDGPEAVSARAAAKAAGVAPAAVYRHFPDKRAFLTACAAEGFRRMAMAIDARKAETGSNPMHQFRAVGEGYLSFSMEEPNLFRLMFRGELIDMEDPDLVAASALVNDLTSIGTETLGDPETDTMVLGWAVVHGLATLALDSQLDAILPDAPTARKEGLLRVIRRIGPALEAM